MALAACGADPAASTTVSETSPVESGDAKVDLVTRFQTISGFGASSAWTQPDMDDALAEQLFSSERGIGLSLLRVHIQPDGDTAERGTAHKAIALGARVWAAPWSPPAEWKGPPLARPDAEPTVNGGALLPEHYADWASSLATFARSMQDEGAPLLYLSAQNEPGYETARWETCVYQPDELVTFVRDYLGPALAEQDVATPILAPETQDWYTLARYGDALLADAGASAFVGAIATHGYGGSAFAYTAPLENGKEFWQTELDDGLQVETYDAGMDSALAVASILHRDLTVANVNAWHYWWIAGIEGSPTNAALTDGISLSRRAYVLGNYSKFVRPGFVRLAATEAPQEGVSVTAFRSANGVEVAIVAVNQNATEVAQHFTLTGGDGTPGGPVNGAAIPFVPWLTSDTAALEQQDVVTMLGGGFDAVLPPRSVTTFTSGYGTANATGEDDATSGGCSCRTAPLGTSPIPPASVLAAIGAAVAFGARRRRRTA